LTTPTALGRMLALPRSVARSLPTPVKSALVGVLCHPLVGRALGGVFSQRIPCRGIPISTDSPSVADHTRAQLFWGMYESAEIRSSERYLDPRLDVVELGSSIGVVSCHVSRRLDPARRLICVEANPQLTPLLTANLAANAPERSTTVVHRAVDYTSTTGHVLLELGSDSTGSRVASSNSGTKRASTRIPTTTLSEILRDQALGDYALIADIEGAEAGIFLDDAPALANCRQIIAELHATTYRGRAYRPEDLVAVLEERGFHVLGRDGGVWALAADAEA
jgi:FkbM family methyltransferase